jgi:hypothetical protein
MKKFAMLVVAVAVLLALPGLAQAQTGSWQPLNHQPSFDVEHALLLTDGTVMAQSIDNYTSWWKLTPDNTGSYVNGTWTQLASMPSGYGPLYYASQVIPNGFVVVQGGEYNFGNGDWTNLGAFYNPATNVWKSLPAPSGWSTIGDAQSILLDNGTYMLANCCTTQEALGDYATKTFSSTGTNKADWNDEEGWTLLPGGDVLTVDTYVNLSCTPTSTNSEIYTPSSGSWASAGSTINQLVDCNSREMGPAVLRPDGTVLATGATKYNSIYNSTNGTWSAGPNFPLVNGQQVDIADGPASILPDGEVLVFASPGVYNTGGVFLRFDGTNWNTEPNTPNGPGDSSYYGGMLDLPTGQILFTDFSNDVEIYTPGATYQSSYQPVITSAPSTVTHGHTGYTIKGTQLSGLSLGATYGDDAQMATNYALVQITNNSTHHVFFCKTHNPSSYAVQSGSAPESTKFDVPATIDHGASKLVVITNGIPSAAKSVTVN